MSMITSRAGAGPKSADDIEKLEKRAKRCVCKRCGGKLKTSLIVYDIYGGAGVELYCPNCEATEYGCEPEIFEMAAYFVEHFQFNYFLDMEENDLNEQLNISKVADMLGWMLKNMGLLNEDGFIDGKPDFDFYKRLH